MFILTIFKDNVELEGGTSMLESEEKMNKGEHNSIEIHCDLQQQAVARRKGRISSL